MVVGIGNGIGIDEWYVVYEGWEEGKGKGKKKH